MENCKVMEERYHMTNDKNTVYISMFRVQNSKRASNGALRDLLQEKQYQRTNRAGWFLGTKTAVWNRSTENKIRNAKPIQETAPGWWYICFESQKSRPRVLPPENIPSQQRYQIHGKRKSVLARMLRSLPQQKCWAKYRQGKSPANFGNSMGFDEQHPNSSTSSWVKMMGKWKTHQNRIDSF